MVSYASKTIDDAMFEARAVVNDATAPYRNADATVVTYLNSALRAVYSIRPDAFIGNFTTGVISTAQLPTYDVTDLGTAIPFPLDDRLFYNPVVAYMAGRIELGDDEFTESARSSQLLAAFVAQLTGV